MYAPGTVTVRRMLNCPIEVPRKNVVTANRAAQSHSKMVHYVWETAFLCRRIWDSPVPVQSSATVSLHLFGCAGR
jgi:hypothetical protein